ncbi:MAG: DUF3619 family protein [Zoogloeaceae bacterium]|jgi:hypothetical protein|nr:DUF3619 family protein [Zoogloeaceae bacterium]
MNRERELAHKIRHYLNLGADEVDRGTADRLFAARRSALARQKTANAQRTLAGIGHIAAEAVLPRVKALIAIAGLITGVVGVSLWNDAEKTAELEEIDIALLADDLPINAYLDKGFQTWISEHPSQD